MERCRIDNPGQTPNMVGLLNTLKIEKRPRALRSSMPKSPQSHAAHWADCNPGAKRKVSGQGAQPPAPPRCHCCASQFFDENSPEPPKKERTEWTLIVLKF